MYRGDVPIFYLAEKDVMENSIASDGSYVYLLTSNGLHKIGTGFGSTVSGRIYVTSKKSFTSSEGILLFFDVFANSFKKYLSVFTYFFYFLL